MTDASVDLSPNQPLGVGAIIGESFSIFFRKIVAIFIVSLVPTVIGLLISGALIGFGTALGTDTPDFTQPGAAVGFAVSTIISIAIYGLTIALLVQLAYDAKLGRPINIGGYLSNGIKNLLPVVILTIVATIAFGIGFALLIVPGLWIYAVICVTVPAIVIDRAGFGGLGRSARLTKGYRWPIVGAVILMFLIIMGVGMVAGIVIGLVGAGAVGAGLGIGAIVALLLVQGVINTLSYGFSSIVTALIFARLKEIKEGVSVDDLVAVFE